LGAHLDDAQVQRDRGSFAVAGHFGELVEKKRSYM
jgi:hypothetical protein